MADIDDEVVRELELVNALMEIRSVSPSGSYEMGVIDEALGKLGYTPWKAINKKREKMNNKIKVMGEVKRERKIKDMEKGEEAYTLPWAYDADKGELNENSPIVDTFCGNNAGTTSMKVKRIDVADYKYTITVPKDYEF